MEGLAFLGFFAILAFVGFVIYWNRKWRGKFFDEREANLRLKVRELISRAVEIMLVAAIGFHFLVRPLSGLEALILVGLAGVCAEAFGNWYVRRDEMPTSEQ